MARIIRMLAFAAVLALAGTTTLTTATLTPTAVVPTTVGPVQGEYNDKSGINIFKGIPYAAPPVGELRFADPQPPAAPSSSVLNATTFSPGCMAFCPPVGFPKPELMCTPTVSEDCLYLNVFAPAKPDSPAVPAPEGARRDRGADGTLPVIFWIHGGNFDFGSGGVPLYDGQQMARTQHVVVVTINYRLNVFGGLFTGAGNIEGNFMMKDQILAMKWVQANIKAFGGDPTRVTISGQSAGAASTATHLMLPASAGLFHRAIIVSNPATLLAARPVGAMQLGMKVVQALGCPESGGVAELECLRNASAEAIMNLTHVDYSFDPKTILNDMMQWVPVVDGNFLPMQPLDAFEQGAINKVPVFFGTVANESIEFIWKLSPKPMSVLSYDALATLVWGFDDAAKVNAAYGPIPESMKHDVRPRLDVIATDFIFYCVNRWIGRQLTKVTPTYMYFYDYLSFVNEWIYGKTMPYCVERVCHAQDLAAIWFPYEWIAMEPGEPTPPPQREAFLSQIVQTAWGNMAYNGEPNPIGAGLPASAISPDTAFPLFNASNTLVNFSTPTAMLDGYRNDMCDLWDSIGYLQRR